jgi:serine/threonine-protein kinase
MSTSNRNVSAKATLLGGVRGAAPGRALPSLTATLLGAAASPLALVSLEHEHGRSDTLPGAPVSTRGRTTVLPRRAAASSSEAIQTEPRFHRLSALGEGAMGYVELARDNDIHRTVAVKRIIGGTDSESALLRFADEIRVVGQLEHPAIVPIYDVGRGDDGQIYLVMKHLQGETMEAIIERLQSGDLAYRERFTPEYRARLFLGVLDAISYAHARGVLHRDLKPANIMIGPYGEVTVMDWGIAKLIDKKEPAASSEALALTLLEKPAQKLLETELGALVGTPLYMSPEQAAGRNDELDERSDVYSLCVVLYEWLVLKHPLREKTTVSAVLNALVWEDYSPGDLFGPAQEAQVPMEYIWLLAQGLARDRSKRYQSVPELEAVLKGIQDGKIRVQCHITLAKSAAQRFIHWIDRHPALYTRLFRTFKVLAIVTLVVLCTASVWAVVAHSPR